MNAEPNQIDVDRLAHRWDLINQTTTLCDAMRTMVTILKQEAAEITAGSMAALEKKISKKKCSLKKK
jgi:hypothetical protein